MQFLSHCLVLCLMRIPGLVEIENLLNLTRPRLLSINNYYYRRGGSEAVYFEHNRLFESAGWEVVPFRIQNTLTLPWGCSVLFANETEGPPRQSLLPKAS